LIERGGDDKVEGRSFFVPKAVIVARNHAEVISSWPTVTIKRLTPGSRFLPGCVEAVQPIAKEDLLRSGEAESRRVSGLVGE
jgi:hypothetical protein